MDAFRLNDENIKETIRIQLTFILEIKLQNKDFSEKKSPIFQLVKRPF